MALDFGLLGNPVNPLQVLQSLALGQQRVQQQQQMAQEQADRQRKQQFDEREFAFREQKFGADQQAGQQKQQDERHELGVKLLNSVTDDASYVRARQIAISRGIEEAAQLPETYDPTAQQAVAAMKQEYAALNPEKQATPPAAIQTLAAMGIDPKSAEGKQILMGHLNPSQYMAFGDNLIQTRGPGVGIPSTGGGDSRGERNGNSGNIKDGPWARSQPGYLGSDGTFAKFAPGAGDAAQEKLLTQNYLGKGFDTPAKIVNRYAPPGENSDASVKNYTAYVAQKLGIGPNDKVSPAQAPALARAMREFETGNTGGGQGGGPRVVATKPPSDADPKVQRKAEADLRKEFDGLPEVKQFKTVRTAFNQIRAVAKNPSAQNDIALIFSYMKMLDPGSVVREGEFATAQNAAGIDERIRNYYNKARTGERLSRAQRAEMVKSAADVYASQRGTYNAAAEQYRSYADDYGVSPDRIARKYVRDKDKQGGGGQITSTIRRIK